MTNQTAKSELIRLAKKHRLKIDFGDRSRDYYELYTQDGYKFPDGTHGRVEPHRNIPEWKREAINELIQFIKEHEKYKTQMLIHCKKGCECGWDE
jgi:predicted protein tyrosine phosphatase